ncbi:hypothetical protein BT93_L1567 [Corymbia citriodora subsp. variegata]|uniref:Uncharacterized protein n=1 Tax=Corymbia citriodora subsp. variegata TaxID=360336 RepID=A0A8T0CNJ5_CORYI|nr:hypothetical protein BT93_L1567 [Corymbia citriodora subsp. variegata]
MSDLGSSFTLEAPPPTTTVHCGICMEDVPSISIFKTTEWCDHSFCSHCISSYIAAKIKDGVANVRCPESNCKAKLDPITCKQLVSSVGFARWCDLLCESAVLGFAKCYCPNSSCREMIINECGGDGVVGGFKCPSCNGSAWFRDEDIHLLERLAKKKQWKRCPQCHIYVECTGGCKNIVCRCKTPFCYGCGRKRCLYSSCACRKELGGYILILEGLALIFLSVLVGSFLYLIYLLWLC